jgi:hypothetical protein
MHGCDRGEAGFIWRDLQTEPPSRWGVFKCLHGETDGHFTPARGENLPAAAHKILARHRRAIGCGCRQDLWDYFTNIAPRYPLPIQQERVEGIAAVRAGG